MKVGLFFGSFNPIHVGHLIIANIVYETTQIDQVWFIVSPQNPLKKSKSLAHEFDRIDMVRAAVNDLYHFKASDIEFGLPKPSYTITTLTLLKEKYPDYTFRLIIGEDNLSSFPRWKNHEDILEDYGLIVYPRPNASEISISHPNIENIEAPKMDISATQIRQFVKAGKSIKFLVPDEAIDIIKARKLYIN